MILGIGIDSIEIQRIEKVFTTDKRRHRIFTGREIRDSQKNRGYSSLAARFAAKEAFAKALGTGIRGITFKEIEVLKTDLGKPYFNEEKLIPHLERVFNKMNFKLHLSMSHDEGRAYAMVIIEEADVRDENCRY